MCAVFIHTRDLERDEAEALLGDLHVGAIAVSFRGRVDIALVNYVYRNGWIYARMEDGPDLETLRHQPWAALEAREAAGTFDWRSVIVRGSVELLRGTDAGATSEGFHDAVAVLRSVVPTVLTPRDPLPQRVQVFRMYADVVSGREARSSFRRGVVNA